MDRRLSDDASNVSSTGSRFKVDSAEGGQGTPTSPVHSASDLPTTPPPQYNSAPIRPDDLPLPPPPQENGHEAKAGEEGGVAHRDILSTGSREGELSVPIIELPDGKTFGRFLVFDDGPRIGRLEAKDCRSWSFSCSS